METVDLSERPRCREDLAAWYTTALEEQEASGLSMSDYAGLVGVTPATLYQWRRRLDSSPSTGPSSQESVGLVEVHVNDLALGQASEAITVRLPNGFEVEVSPTFDDETLNRLLRVLERC